MNLIKSTPGNFAAFKTDCIDVPDLIILQKSAEFSSLPFNPIETDPELDELFRNSKDYERFDYVYGYKATGDWLCSYFSEKKGKIVRVQMFDFELLAKQPGLGLHDAASAISLTPGSVVSSRFFNCRYVFTLIKEVEGGFWIASYWDRLLDSFRKIRLHVNEITIP